MSPSQQTLLVILLSLLSVGYLLWLVKRPKQKSACHHDCGCEKNPKADQNTHRHRKS